MKISNIAMALGAAALAICAVSCGKQQGWKVEGNVAGATDKDTLYVEAATFNYWQPVDSIALGSDGDFEYAAAEGSAIPTIYRLRLADKYIYFPVDSAETVTVRANAKNFDRGYSLSGNIYAAGIQKADSLIGAAVDSKGSAGALADKSLKDNLNLIVNQDTTCLVSYYVIGKFIGNTPLYNLSDKKDVRILANAANNYKRFRPQSPRAAELENRWIEARRALVTAGTTTLQAQLSSRPVVEMKFYDVRGKEHDFDKVVSRGGVTVLNFTRYDGEASQANTLALKKIYDQYHGQGLEIYQVAYDPDEMNWKRSAANMPWIAVWSAPTDKAAPLLAYNVDPIHGGPVSFVFNSLGELIERVSSPDQLSAAVAKAF